MSSIVNHDKASKEINHAWSEINLKNRPPARMQQLIEQILTATDVTFKYILVTGYLAKCVNPSIHARALQVSSNLKDSYDARSLCHKVIVGFEKTKGNLFGLSNEPFVNKPARHPEHDGSNKQLRNKLVAQKLHEVLEIANSSTAKEVFQGLVHILRVSAKNVSAKRKTRIKRRVSAKIVQDFIEKFLQESDGGSRLVGVWGAIMALISENGKLSVNPPNVSDKFGKTAGDIEIRYNNKLVATSECKHRPLNLDDVKHGIKKALENNVPELHFVTAAGLSKGQEKSIRKELVIHSNEIDLLLVDIWSSRNLLAGILNPIRRAKFGETVTSLMNQMRKYQSAIQATNLWNKLTS